VYLSLPAVFYKVAFFIVRVRSHDSDAMPFPFDLWSASLTVQCHNKGTRPQDSPDDRALFRPFLPSSRQRLQGQAGLPQLHFAFVSLLWSLNFFKVSLYLLRR